MKKLALTMAAACSILTTPALAADMSENQAFDWSGFYIGAQGGLQEIRDKWSRTPTGGPTNVNAKVTESGLIAGIHAGYNHQAGSFVLGIEGDIEAFPSTWGYSEMRRGGMAPGTVWSNKAEINVQGSLRARIGMPVDQALFYATGGLAYANVTHSYADTSWKGWPLWENNPHKFDDNMIGFTIGAGIEYAVTEQFTTRIEYRYTDLGTARNFNAGWNEVDSQDMTSHALRFGVSYRF